MSLWERLEPVEDIKTLCDKEPSDSKYLFGENLLESMKEAKESFRISNSLVNNSTTKVQKVSYQSDSKHSFEYKDSGANARFSASHSLNFQGRKRNHPHRGQSSSSTKYVTSKKSHKYWENVHPMQVCFCNSFSNIKNICTSAVDILKLVSIPTYFWLGRDHFRPRGASYYSHDETRIWGKAFTGRIFRISNSKKSAFDSREVNKLL